MLTANEMKILTETTLPVTATDEYIEITLLRELIAVATSYIRPQYECPVTVPLNVDINIVIDELKKAEYYVLPMGIRILYISWKGTQNILPVVNVVTTATGYKKEGP